MEHPSETLRYQWGRADGFDWLDGQTVTVSVKTGNRDATGEPDIAGTPQVGQVLTAEEGDIDDDDGLPDTFPDDYMFQWVRVDSGTETDITGATAQTYTPVAADIGKTLKVKVSFNDDGNTLETRPSAATAAVVRAPEDCAADRSDSDWCTTMTVGMATAAGKTFYGYSIPHLVAVLERLTTTSWSRRKASRTSSGPRL